MYIVFEQHSMKKLNNFNYYQLEPEPLEKSQEPEPLKNLPAPQPCLRQYVFQKSMEKPDIFYNIYDFEIGILT